MNSWIPIANERKVLKYKNNYNYTYNYDHINGIRYDLDQID